MNAAEISAANLAEALRLAGAGLSVFPCTADKRPRGKWRTISTTRTETIRFWWRSWPESIIGLDLSKSDLIAIDADRHEGQADGVAALSTLETEHEPLPERPITNTPSNGQHHFFKQPDGEPLGNGEGSLPDGINVRGNGGYVIAAGSLIDEGKGWFSDTDSPDLAESVKAGTLPVLSDWLAAIIKTPKLRSPEPPPRAPDDTTERKLSDGHRERAFALAALEGCKTELEGLPPGGRNTALNGLAYRMGRMVARGWISASDVEHSLWSACEANGLLREDGPKQCRDSINSGLKAGQGKPHEDLADRPEPPRLITLDGVRVDDDGQILDDVPLPQLVAEAEALEPLTYCDGLVGQLVDWMCDTARRPNRVLALGAAVTVIGTLIGRKAATPTRSATHLYVIGLADSGAGKQHALECIPILLRAARADNTIGPSEFTSQSAVQNFIKRRPLSLCAQDEFGAFLKRANNKRASGWENAISKVFRTAWGISFTQLITPEWAGREFEVINAPALSIYGVSTPREFFEALQGGDVDNGFLNRLLVMASNKRADETDPEKNHLKVPEEIATSLKLLYAYGMSGVAASSVQRENLCPTPLVVPWTGDKDGPAHSVYKEYSESVTQRMRRDPELEPFLARAAEMSVRLATIRACGRFGHKASVDVSDIEWGRDIATICIEQVAQRAKAFMVIEMSNAQVQNKILEIVNRRGGRASEQVLMRAVKQSVRSQKDFDSTVGVLIGAKLIKKEMVASTSGPPTPVYVAC